MLSARTALYDALGYVLADPVKRLRGERTAIVVISDGDDNRSFVPFPAILEALVESGALVYPLYIPSGLIPEGSVPKPEVTIDPLRTRYLTLTTRADEEGKKLALASGGVYYPIHRLEDLQRAYDDVVVQSHRLHDHLRFQCPFPMTRAYACARIATARRSVSRW